MLYRHFAYRAAEEVIKKFPNKDVYIVEAGATPSGKIHLGNFNDVIISDAVLKALKDLGYSSDGFLVIDSRDPFRQPPIFAPKEFIRESESYVGRPFIEIPDPWGCHENYAEHFVDPVQKNMEKYGVEIGIKWAQEIHSNIVFIKLLLRLIDNRDKVIEIYNDVRRRAGHTNLYPRNWIPFRPQCSKCGRIDESVEIIGLVDKYRVKYRCKSCGNMDIANIERMEGKPPWRIDWPLRWVALNIAFEPLGKDHMASGSGYEMGCNLLRKFFEREPPVPVFYDFVYWVERGDEKRVLKFSKRRGIGLGVDEWLKYAPPEVLRFYILRRDVSDIYSEALSHWDFDITQIPQYVQSFDKFEETYFNIVEKAIDQVKNQVIVDTYLLSVVRKPKKRIRRISYWQLARIAVWMIDIDDGMRMLRRQGKLKDLSEEELIDVRNRLNMALNWTKIVGLKAVLPSIDKLKEIFKQISGEEKLIFKTFLEAVVSGKLSENNVQEYMLKFAETMGYKTRKERLKIYQTIYKILLGEESGPPLRRMLSKREFRKYLEAIYTKLTGSF